MARVVLIEGSRRGQAVRIGGIPVVGGASGPVYGVGGDVGGTGTVTGAVGLIYVGGGSHGTVTGAMGLMNPAGMMRVGMVSRAGLKVRRVRIAYLLMKRG